MRKTHWFLGAVLFLLAARGHADEVVPAATAEDWTQVPVVKLRKAVSDHLVEATGSNPQSYHAVTLHLRNATSARVAVDIAGSYLTPSARGSCQRLGLGPAITPSATVRSGKSSAVVLLEPGAARDLDVNTCCLDLGLPAPEAQSFVASSSELPKVREDVLRWWAENPDTPQNCVNSAIWTNSPKVRIDPAATDTTPRPKRLSGKVRNGTYFELADGELRSIDAEGMVRLLGNQILQVIPTDDALYSVMLGDDASPKLWRLEITGERCWSRVMDLEDGALVHDVLNAGRGCLVVVTDKGVDFHDTKKDKTTRVVAGDEAGRVSVRRAAGDRLIVTARRPAKAATYSGGERQGAAQSVFELWTLALDTGKAERTREFWNVASMLAGPAGVFALAPTQGGLRTLSGNSFTDIGPNASYGRVVAVATDVVWLADPSGRLVAADARTGRVRFRTEISLAEANASNVDPATGDLAYARGEEFRWVHAADGKETSSRMR